MYPTLTKNMLKSDHKPYRIIPLLQKYSLQFIWNNHINVCVKVHESWLNPFLSIYFKKKGYTIVLDYFDM